MGYFWYSTPNPHWLVLVCHRTEIHQLGLMSSYVKEYLEKRFWTLSMYWHYLHLHLFWIFFHGSQFLICNVAMMTFSFFLNMLYQTNPFLLLYRHCPIPLNLMYKKKIQKSMFSTTKHWLALQKPITITTTMWISQFL